MSTPEKVIHIDIPVKLAEVKVVFSIASLKPQVFAIFHTNAGHVTLHDQAYNADRKIATGNPYKQLVLDLIKRGVHVELCGATAKVHNYGNADLLPGIPINTDAMARTTQLVQEGFIKMSES
jgi:intracellular sulfur oxidation DsrE/DsrF family protein